MLGLKVFAQLDLSGAVHSAMGNSASWENETRFLDMPVAGLTDSSVAGVVAGAVLLLLYITVHCATRNYTSSKMSMILRYIVFGAADCPTGKSTSSSLPQR